MLPYLLLPLSLVALRQAPVGTELHVRLLTPVGSYASRSGNPVSAVLIAPVRVDDQTILPEGSMLSGRVLHVGKVGYGFVHETASLAISFDAVTLPSGKTLPLSTRLADVDGSRESVVPDGGIRGVRSTSAISYRFNGYIRIALSWEIHARIAFWIIRTLLIHVPEPEIYYPSGVEMTLALSAPLYGNPQQVAADSARRLSKEEREVLEPLIDGMPVETRALVTNRESDLVNLMFIGSRDAIARAFTASGWTRATATTMRSKYLGVNAFVEGHGYNEFPMSTLLLDGQAPGMFWQKGLNDMAKRHHIRLWKQDDTWDGEEIWLGAATRDVDFAYLRNGQMMTHKIERNIDREREKILYDLEFTGCTDVADYVERPYVPQFAFNATGDSMKTDGRIAVLHLNGCEVPHTVRWAGRPLPAHGNAMQRIARAQVLGIRNDLCRGNLYWRTYEGTRYLVAAIRRRQRAKDSDTEEAVVRKPRKGSAKEWIARAMSSSWAQ